MNKNQIITWHYIMDIHEPEEIWYSEFIIQTDGGLLIPQNGR